MCRHGHSSEVNMFKVTEVRTWRPASGCANCCLYTNAMACLARCTFCPWAGILSCYVMHLPLVLYHVVVTICASSLHICTFWFFIAMLSLCKVDTTCCSADAVAPAHCVHTVCMHPTGPSLSEPQCLNPMYLYYSYPAQQVKNLVTVQLVVLQLIA